MIGRYASAATSGTLITFALLYAMQGLINLQHQPNPDARPHDIVSWVSLNKPAPPPPLPRPIVDKDILSQAPVPPPLARSGGSGPGIVIGTGLPEPGPVPTMPTNMAAPDGPLIAIVRVEPTYPAAAQARGIEGWVDVRFDMPD